MDKFHALVSLVSEYPKDHPVRVAVTVALIVSLVLGYSIYG